MCMQDEMSNISDIFSIRVVIVDFYMEKPILGLDPCYSEFRGKEIKKVPVIRIFGANANGQKTCMHVHGVFPYFYIPYEQKEFETADKAIYQISTCIDKAINISLGRSSSLAQHVFKVQLVKGIPFYGYHRTEHQFLKIYMFNPRFVRRAANLLQGGAVLNKNFHSYESHVPYILQFMIDYNLYGMSFLHAPLEVIKFRKAKSTDTEVNDNDSQIAYPSVKSAQILNIKLATKISNSALEVDVGSHFILNRFQLVINSNNSLHANPGIEAIWHDEHIRRQKLIASLADDHEKLKKIPILEVPISQERVGVQLTKSDNFHRTVLANKLLTTEFSELLNGNTDEIAGSQADQLLNNTFQSTVTNKLDLKGSKEQKSTFNLRKLLANAVYPEECTSDENLANASFIENHLSNGSSTLSYNFPSDHTAARDDSVYLDDTTIDEDLVYCLTSQSQVSLSTTLRDEDKELLDVLQQLEEANERENQIDLDSTLAPLSQSLQDDDDICLDDLIINLSPELLKKETLAATVNKTTCDSDRNVDANYDHNAPDFSMIVEDFNEVLLSQTPRAENAEKLNIPQMDGSDDMPHTPKKPQSSRAHLKSIRTSPRTPKRLKNTRSSLKRSPRTLNSSVSKYTPLPLQITHRFEEQQRSGIKQEQMTSVRSAAAQHTEQSSKIALPKKTTLVRLRRISMPSTVTAEETSRASMEIKPTTNTPIHRARRSIDLDATNITCAFTPHRKHERILKAYNVNEIAAESASNAIKGQIMQSSAKLESNFVKLRKCRVIIKPLVIEDANIENCTKSSIKSSVVTTETIAHTTAKCENITNSLLEERINEITSAHNHEDCDEIAASDTEEARQSINRKRKRRSLYLVRNSHTNKKHKNSLLQVFFKSNMIETATNNKQICSTSPPNSAECEDQVKGADLMIQSFYENPFFEFSSPQLTYSSESPEYTKEKLPKLQKHKQQSIVPSPSTSHRVLAPELDYFADPPTCNVVELTPLLVPPTTEEILNLCEKLNIHEYNFQEPYYSNPDDITKQKEIGHIALQIPGQKLNDCTEFVSVLGDKLKGLTEWRQKKFAKMYGTTLKAIEFNAQQLREYFAKQTRIVITPQLSAPFRYEAKLWLKARELLKDEKKVTANKDNVIRKDSTIKLTEGVGNECTNNDRDISNISSTLNPLTPVYTKADLSVESPYNTSLTTVPGHSDHKRKRGAKKTKLSLNVRLKAAIDKGKFHSDERDVTPLLALVKSSESLKATNDSCESASLNDSSSVSSEIVLTELKCNSFVRQVEDNNSATNESVFGLTNVTLDNTFDFKVNFGNLQEAKANIEFNYLTTMALELFVPTRENLLPDPAIDEIRCIFYAIENSIPTESRSPTATTLPQNIYGYIIVNGTGDELREGKIHGVDVAVDVMVVNSEFEAFTALIELCLHWDPDIYVGYEIEMASWGYIMERAKTLHFNITPLLSRVPTEQERDIVEEDREHFTDIDVEAHSQVKLCGRILLDVWRLMRSEIALNSYTFENVMYHILHRRTPFHSFRKLSSWFATPCSRWIVIEYYLDRVHGTLALLAQLDLIGRTSEMAKLIGIQFYEVLARGSQFRVESMMLRIAKPKNIVPLSPSVQQRAHMRAPEYLPLILEPQSRFYVDPVIVLDFQSLYPSMIIAYNYCFSTCLGRVEHLGHSTPFEFGASQLRVAPAILRKLLDQDLVNISPGGVVFVKSTVREGILPRMLVEILDTRQMVKQSMKLHKANSALQRILHSRQLGLKLMANVTYGYTAANFSGRMPAVEVGDSVVAKGRETLERAIKLVETNEKWRVQVVYGDTDSMFVLVPGRNRAQAFKIGEEIAEAVTKSNPQPVKLKLEKVYHPCILQTKKRYVGYMYETADQVEPVYEAKGIETVRRDGCPAVAKMLEKVLRILFESANVSQVKQYVCRQFTKLLAGRINMQDLIFAKEFRGLNGYKPTACVPALELTRKWQKTDPRHIPRCGERVPFVIVNGPPGLPLIRLVRSPCEVLSDEGLKINVIYYITKAIIPPLNRCLLLIGADVHEWFASLPRKVLLTTPLSMANELVPSKVTDQIKKSTISQYFSVADCVVDCGRQTKRGICERCAIDKQKTFYVLHSKIAKVERGFQLTRQICKACCGRDSNLDCNSLDCPVLYVHEIKRRELKQIEYFQNLLIDPF